MYTLEKTQTAKTVVLIFAIICLILTFIGFISGDGFMNELLASIVMVVAFFSFIILVLVYFVICALQKDIAVELQMQANQLARHKQEHL